MNEKTENYIVEDGTLTWINPLLKEFTIPEGVIKVNLGDGSNSKLERIVFASTVTKISDYGLARLNNLKEIKLNEGLDFIENRAFLQTSISTIELPSTVRKVGPYAFYRCNNLEKVVINGELTYFESCVFNGCDKLKEITLNMSCKFIPSLIDILKNKDIKILNYCYFGKEISSGEYNFPELEKVNLIFNNNEELLKLLISDDLFDILNKFNDSYADVKFIVKEEAKEETITCHSDDICSKLNKIYDECCDDIIIFNSVIRYILRSEQNDNRYKKLGIEEKVKENLSHVAETIEGKISVDVVLSDIFAFYSKYRNNHMNYNKQVKELYEIYNTAILKLKGYNVNCDGYIERMNGLCFDYINKLLNTDIDSSRVLEGFWTFVKMHISDVYHRVLMAETNAADEKVDCIIKNRIYNYSHR